jgi:hypothetical protein
VNARPVLRRRMPRNWGSGMRPVNCYQALRRRVPEELDRGSDFDVNIRSAVTML